MVAIIHMSISSRVGKERLCEVLYWRNYWRLTYCEKRIWALRLYCWSFDLRVVKHVNPNSMLTLSVLRVMCWSWCVEDWCVETDVLKTACMLHWRLLVENVASSWSCLRGAECVDIKTIAMTEKTTSRVCNYKRCWELISLGSLGAATSLLQDNVLRYYCNFS